MLKNAIDYLYAEWNIKAVGFVSYGAVGGARAAEHLRLIAGELQMADVRQQVALSLLTEFENFSVFRPGDYNRAALDTLLDQVIAWSTALAPLRQPAAAVPVTVKIPEPITAPIPNATRLQTPRVFLRAFPGSSDAAISASMLFVRKS